MPLVYHLFWCSIATYISDPWLVIKIYLMSFMAGFIRIVGNNNTCIRFKGRKIVMLKNQFGKFDKSLSLKL